jgi:hypothetical protein
MPGQDASSGDPTASFIFVPTGDPEPTEWMAAHPNWIKLPATLVPRGSASSGPAVPAGIAAATVAEAAADAAPGIAAGPGAGFLVAAADLLATVAVPLEVLGILFYPSRTVSGEQEQALLHPEGFDPSPATPPLPGLVPPATNGPTPGTGGFAPPPFPPPPPGLVPAPSSPTVLPGRPAEEQEPTILRQDRNDGPTDKTPRNSRRARAGAELADPKVTGALARADWRAHHLINVAALRAAPELIAAAARAGWRIDDPANVAPLPASREAQETLKATGTNRPVHDSGHQNWNAEVEERLKTIEQELRDEKDQLGTEAYDRQARKELEELQTDLRQKMMQLDRLTENGLVSHTASV